MESVPVSKWAEARFGGLATELATAIKQAISTAHDLALKAHLSGEMDHNDTYGHTLKVKMNEVLADNLREVPGVVLRKPVGGRYHLPVVEETSMALLPIRYSTDRRVAREDAKIDLSAYRRSLLVLVGSNPAKGRQLSIEDALSEVEDFEAHDEQLRELDAQLAVFGQVATIGFASNPTSGLWGLGWGDLRIDESNDIAVWESWEALPDVPSDPVATADRPVLRSAPSVDGARYFDQTDESDDLGLLPRQPQTGAMSPEVPGDSGSKGAASNS